MVGFESYNADGSIQFSTALSTYGYKGKLTVNGALNIQYLHYTFTVNNAISPIIYVRPGRSYAYPGETDGFAVTNIAINGSNWTYTVTTKYYGFSTAQITVYIYDKMTAGGSFGLQVFDANSNITFNSNQIPVIIAASVVLPEAPAGLNPPSTTYSSLPTGRTYAANVTGLRIGMDIQTDGMGGPNFSELYEEWVAVRTDGFRAFFEGNGEEMTTGGFPGRFWQKGSPIVSIIDVTGI